MDHQTKLAVSREYLGQVKAHLDSRFADTAEERRRINHAEEENGFAFSILGEIEILHTDLAGYASQISLRGTIRQNPDEAIRHLHELRIFDSEKFMAWYRTQGEQYPTFKAYIQDLDYLRLLLIEYIQQSATKT